MRCRRCRTEMVQTDTLLEGSVRQTWYRCPVCDAGQTIAQPMEPRLRRIGTLQRCTGERPARPGVPGAGA